MKADCTQVYLPLTYKYLSGLDENRGQNYRTDDFICLNLPPRIQAILLKATNIWTSAKAQYEEINGALIEYSIHTTDQHLKSCLNSFNLDARLTAEFLQQAIQNIFFKVSNGDFWTLAVLSGNPRVIGATQLHYTTLANLKLFEDYQKGIKVIFKEAIELPQKNSPNLFIGYGNPIRPIKSIVQKELNHLSSFLATRVGQDSIKLSTEELIETLNLVMLFVETYCSYFNAIRNVTNPYIGLQSIDHEGFCAIADKIIQNGYNTRIIPVLKPVEETLRQFEDYILSLMDVFRRKKLAKWSDFFAEKLQPEFKWRGLLAPNRNFPGYFLISPELKLKAGKRPKVKFIPYTRKAALKFYEGTEQFKSPLFLQLAPNANRHFLRSALLERGVNPEYIDEFMGHRHFGTESWNHNSIFDPQDYRKTIKAELYKVYGDFKISLPFKPNSKQVSDKTNTECPDTTQRHSNS
ncbi:hypothetical protein [Thiosulfativibrio zosterae]|uniref:Uncharacterized protein n=1 Tax=Thiosulfativibrio zosterae TaxID=2675053 RepID=A0A6F8PQW9_9GAMM|nr:hypothetical protein [Thiosulfativibrio zosterae]BBP44509.1 hypothetical protein THMIRHAT_22550 [Thiosulfativibrio zosterae]